MTGHDGVQSEDLQRGFEQLGIRGGDALFFHSSLRSFGRVNGGAETVIDSGVSAVGLEGTVAVPTFVQKVDGKRASYRQRAQAWDIHASPSDVGFITEMFCKRSDSVRSDHCCVSVAAIGAGALEAISGHRDAKGRPSPWDDSAYGHGSPWDWLWKRNGAYLLMGVGFNVCSLFHYCQALWVESNCSGERDGLLWPGFEFVAMGERLKSAGLVRKTSVGRSTWLSFRVAPCVNLVQKILEAEPALIQWAPLRLWGDDEG